MKKPVMSDKIWFYIVISWQIAGIVFSLYQIYTLNS